MTKNYLCPCGEKEPEKFYVSRKNLCKSCILKKEKSKYGNYSHEEKNTYINKQKEWANENLIQFRLLSAKHRAIRKKIDFNIDFEYIEGLLKLQNFKCKYSGVTLKLYNKGELNKENRIFKDVISIDRIDSSKGYVKGNVVLVTAFINCMKNDLSEHDFLEIVKLINKHSIKT